METMMMLGPYRFSINTAAYQNLTRTSEFRWVSQERVGRHPAMQFVGAGHETINLDGIIYPRKAADLAQLDAMRSMAGTGSPLILVSGMGRVFGSFCILTIDEAQTIFWPNGAPRKIEFGLQLKSYGADGGFL